MTARLQLRWLPALEHPELLAEPVTAALRAWPLADQVQVTEIDPDLADTQAMSEAYGVDLSRGANCVVVAGRRAGEVRVAACVVLATTRADVNNLVKRTLDVRKASFLSMDDAVARSRMEYGGITPIGLPCAWRLLVDSGVTATQDVIIGSGVRRSKLLVPGRVLAEYPPAEVVPGLGI